jgi:hypothetical protein
MKKVDITGLRFGRLVAVREAGRSRGGQVTWDCQCDCGNTTVVLGTFLRYGNTKSCGCGKNAQRTPDGHWRTWDAPRRRLYRAWVAMRNRCNNSRGPDYRYYGGRGVRVCSAWDSFLQFERDMGPHPGVGWTLDRRGNDGDYDPDNCRWATRRTQGQNRSYNILDRKQAEQIRKSYATGWFRQIDLAKLYGVNQSHISQVLLGKVW